ncbi:hypothetical protein NLG97_g4939 [Lecanicillium saksenae]|uniref:Uncharacterized protein n=1 Tax=Lecanicillium saksenae TaxID=468837 RepID=A0ACC1QTW4_9HYPO|nr:hypothetical protein NLG97_g4939 [Lecanicillium saksenae]
MVQQENTVSAAVKRCLTLFTPVLSGIEDVSGGTTHTQLAHERSRFKLWSANIGAHRTGASSLDYRLRDASNIRLNVLELVRDLAQLLDDYAGIVRGEVIPWDTDMTEPIEEGAPETELEQIMIHMKETVDSLLGLSITIRNPAPHDRFMATVATNVSFYEPHDVNHVKELYGELPPWQAERLGGAISKRRQYFRYRQAHREKLAFGIDDDADAGVDVDSQAPSTFASSIPLHLKSESSSRAPKNEEDGQDYLSQTSVATSVGEGTTRRIPALPEDAKKHVFEDLRPYVCLYEDCTDAEYGYAYLSDWITHTKERHLIEYKCPVQSCAWTSTNKVSFTVHSTESHSSEILKYGIETLLDLVRVEIREQETSHCPFCRELQSSTKNYYRHVGRHMEDLSIFALPLDIDENTPASETDGDDGENSEVPPVSEEPPECPVAEREPLPPGPLDTRRSPSASTSTRGLRPLLSFAGSTVYEQGPRPLYRPTPSLASAGYDGERRGYTSYAIDSGYFTREGDSCRSEEYLEKKQSKMTPVPDIGGSR